MENSEKQNVNLGLKKLAKNIRKNPLRKINNFQKNIIPSNKYPYIQSDKVHIVDKDDFKSFVQHTTGTQINRSQPLDENRRLQKNRPPPLSILRPQVPVLASAPVAPSIAPLNAVSTDPLQLGSRSALVENSQTNIVESPISAFMRNFEESTMDFGNSSGASLSTIDTNQHFQMDNCNQFMNGLPSSQTNGPQSPASEFPLSWPTCNMNSVSPQSPDRPLLSPSLFSSPSSPEYPFNPYLQNNGISSSDPGSPLSLGNFPFSKV